MNISAPPSLSLSPDHPRITKLTPESLFPPNLTSPAPSYPHAKPGSTPISNRQDSLVNSPIELTTPPPAPGSPKFILPRNPLETIQFLGFTHARAARLAETDSVLRTHPLKSSISLSPFSQPCLYEGEYCGSDSVVVTYAGFLETVLESIPDRIGLDYKEYFASKGIRQEFAAAILSDEFADMRGTGSPAYWCREGVKARWALLMRLRSGGPRKPSSNPPFSAQPTSQHQRAESKKSSAKSSEFSNKKNKVVVDTAETETHITLYRGGSLHLTPTLLLTHFLNPMLLLTPLLHTRHERADFSRFQALYLTPQRALATRLAAYLSHLSYSLHAGTLLALRVPRSFLATLPSCDLWLDNDRDAQLWKRVVWKSRYGFATSPSALKKFGFVRGAVSTGHEGAMLRPLATEAKELGEENVLWVDPCEGQDKRVVGVQWMFSADREVLLGLARAVEERGQWEISELEG